MSPRTLLPSALSLLIAAGCQALRQPEPAAGAAPTIRAPAVTPAADAARGPVEGVATYVERIKMPPGASLRVDAVDAAGRLVASTTVQDVAGPPIAFSISTPRTGVSLRAMLDGPDGEHWFETLAPVPVAASGGPIELRMRRSTGRSAHAISTPGRVAHWECGELGVMSRLQGGRMRLSYNGSSRTLSPAGADAKGRYRDTAGNAFAIAGTTAVLALDGAPARDCVPAAQPSPWNTAVLDGAMLRAVGNEPGWHAQVSGSPAMLKATLDYGEHVLDTPVRATETGFEGNELPGKPVRLLVRRVPCQDGMSGQQFEATVTLQALGRTYAGCGADLRD